MIQSDDGDLYTTQLNVGAVLVRTDYHRAIAEMNRAGCVDVTEDILDKLLETFEAFDIDLKDVDRFTWDDEQGRTFWHIIMPRGMETK